MVQLRPSSQTTSPLFVTPSAFEVGGPCQRPARGADPDRFPAMDDPALFGQGSSSLSTRREGCALVISIRRVSLGGGYRYLMESVAAGDGAAEHSSLTAYYAASGTPPGVFLGAGLAELDGGRGVAIGSRGLRGAPLQHARRCWPTRSPASRSAVSPKAPRGGLPVAGFDLTFSPSKSVSVAWALADEDTKAVIATCHRQAIEHILAYAEQAVFRSRSGTNGIVEEDVTGIVAAAFTHFSSRADDPQLHDHVIVWNRARSVSDGRWRTLDSRAIFKATTTLSELHQGVLSDLLTAALGVGWEARTRRHGAAPATRSPGSPRQLMAEFSQRSEQIAEASAKLRAAFRAAHGRSPTPVEDMALHHRATIATRGDKAHRSLAELTERVASTSRCPSSRPGAARLRRVPAGPQRPAAAPCRRPRRGDPRGRRPGGRAKRGRAPRHLRPPEPAGRGAPDAPRGALRLSRGPGRCRRADHRAGHRGLARAQPPAAAPHPDPVPAS